MAGWAQSRCRCGRGGPSPGADVARVRTDGAIACARLRAADFDVLRGGACARTQLRKASSVRLSPLSVPVKALLVPLSALSVPVTALSVPSSALSVPVKALDGERQRRGGASQRMRSDLSGRRGANEPEARALACASHSLVCGTDMRCAYAVQQPTPRLQIVGGCGAVGSGGRRRGTA